MAYDYLFRMWEKYNKKRHFQNKCYKEKIKHYPSLSPIFFLSLWPEDIDWSLKNNPTVHRPLYYTLTLHRIKVRFGFLCCSWNKLRDQV